MALGPAMWAKCKPFYDSLTLAEDGIDGEKEFASRPHLTKKFKHYLPFWQRHVCPATNRPRGKMTFMAGTSHIVAKVAALNYSILIKLLDADDSLVRVRADDLGARFRNWRDAIEAAGNALQLTTELQTAITGMPKPREEPKIPFLVHQLTGQTTDPFNEWRNINLFEDWREKWADDRSNAIEYRNFLVHEGYVFTRMVRQVVGDRVVGTQRYVLNREAFATRVSWLDAARSPIDCHDDWIPLQTVADELFEETLEFIDRFYAPLLKCMDGWLTDAKYQQLWGWDESTSLPTAPIHRSCALTTGTTSSAISAVTSAVVDADGNPVK